MSMSNKDGHDSDSPRPPLSGGREPLLHMDRERQGPDRYLPQPTKRYQTLLPALESSTPRTVPSSIDTHRKLPPKRKLVLVACSRCRAKKEKCDGERPSCGRCISKFAQCQYEVEDVKVTRTSALKRKCDNFQDENERLRELLGLLRQKPKPEAQDILLRIRSSEDPLAVWQSIKDAELLLPLDTSGPGSDAGTDPRLEKIEAEALADSQVKVKARPWTAVAGDGIVSDLVSSFFAWDNGFRFSFIDRDCFLEDMALGAPEKARYCSPFLVNALCAFRCYNSARAKAFGDISGEDLTTRFASEAKRLLALERGRGSLPTVHGLVLLFMTTVFDGSDRVGAMYRLMSSDMLKQLNLETKLDAIESDPLKNDEKRAFSKALWGHFIFENMVAYTYLRPSLIGAPRISRTWLEAEQENHASDLPEATDLKGKRIFSKAGRPPPSVPGVLDAASEVANLLYESTKYNATYGIIPGSVEDLEVRRGLYVKAVDLMDSLPARLRARSNLTPQTCLLSVLAEEVAISILRPLHRGTIFGHQGESVRDLFFQHCQTTVGLLDQYVQNWPLVEYTYTIVCCTNSVALALVPVLDDTRTHDMFARACEIIDASSRDFPISTYVLQGIQALAWALKVKIPAAAAAHLESSASDGIGDQELRDLPVGLRIPYLDVAGNAAPGDGKDAAAQGAELGVLLSKWSAMSLAE